MAPGRVLVALPDGFAPRFTSIEVNKIFEYVFNFTI